MTSTYKVEHENGTSTVDGVFGISHRDHLVFLNGEGKVFAGFAEGTWHSFKKVEVEVATDVLTRDQVFALPVGTRVKSTRDESEFEVVEEGVAHVVYDDGIPRPEAYQHYSDMNLMPSYTEFKVIA